MDMEFDASRNEYHCWLESNTCAFKFSEAIPLDMPWCTVIGSSCTNPLLHWTEQGHTGQAAEIKLGGSTTNSIENASGTAATAAGQARGGIADWRSPVPG
jgi:hypothetical protein